MALTRKIYTYLLCALGFCFSSLYLWSYLSQSQNSLRTVVFGLFLIVVMLAMISWRAAIFTFIFCVPLFNTLPTILQVNNLWPPFSFNLLYLSGLSTAFLVYVVTGHPLKTRARYHNGGLNSSPYDVLWLLLIVLTVLGTAVGALRYENVFCPGFFRSLPDKLAAIPFASQTSNTLCYTRAMQFVFMTLAFYFVSSALRSQRDVYTVLKLLLISSVFASLYGIWQHHTGLFMVGIQVFFKRINATFNGPDSAATYFLVIMLLSCAAFFFAKKIVHFLMIAAVMALSAVCLYFTETRTAIYAMVMALFFTFLLAVTRSKVFLRSLPVVICLVGLFVFFAPGNRLKLPGRYLMQNLKTQRAFQGMDKLRIEPRKIDEWLSFRSYHWYATVGAIKESPVFGHGLGTLDKLYKKFKTTRDQYQSAFAHNLYLDYYAELGLPGFLLIISFFVLSIFLAWRLWSNLCCGKHVRSLALALLATQFSIGLGNLFSSSLYYVTELMFLQCILMAMLSNLFTFYYPPGEISLKREFLASARTVWKKPSLRLAFLGSAAVVLIIFFWRCSVSAKLGEAQYYSCEPYDNQAHILEYGISHYEYDQHSNKFARTERCVYRPMKMNSRFLQLYLRAGHPDANLKPVPATFTVNGKLAGSCVLSNRNWRACILDLGNIVPQLTNDHALAEGLVVPISFGMTSGRMWNPLDWNPTEKNIHYGVDLGTVIQGLY